MLIDRVLPRYDVTQVVEVDVHAPLDVTYDAIRETDLRDPLVDRLFLIRELPQRIARRWRGEPPPPKGPITFKEVAHEGPGWAELGEEPGREFVVGSVGKFWRMDYGGRPVTAEEFLAFTEPGFARIAVSLSVALSLHGTTMLRYEARTATTDVEARQAFARYWALIRPGVGLVMRRVLKRIKAQAEALTPAATS